MMNFNPNLSLNLLESITLPAYLTIMAAILVSYFSQLTAETILQDPPLYALFMGGELFELMAQLRALSDELRNLVRDGDFPGLIESMDRYRNVVELHTKCEEMFHEWQRILSSIEQIAAANNMIYLNDLYNVLDQLSERLREENNFLVETLRLLEDNIRDRNPVFEFLTRQWFE